MLVDGIDGKRPRRIGRGRQDICLSANLDDIRRMTAARTFGMKRVDVAALKRSNRVLNKPGLIQGIGVDRNRDVGFFGDGQATVDGCRRRTPILVQLKAARPTCNLLLFFGP